MLPIQTVVEISLLCWTVHQVPSFLFSQPFFSLVLREVLGKFLLLWTPQACRRPPSWTKQGIYFVLACHIVVHILTRMNVPLYWTEINYPYHWSTMPATDQLSPSLISSPKQFTCPYHWSAVPNNNYFSLPLISSPLHWSVGPNDGYNSVSKYSSSYVKWRLVLLYMRNYCGIFYLVYLDTES